MTMAALVIGCAPNSAPVASQPALSAPAPALGPPLACCRDYENIKRLNGKRVTIEGTYHPVFLQKRIGPLPDHDNEGNPATTVSIETATRQSFMLEIYYAEQGKRTPEERQRFSGKQVRVTGTLHERTPSQTGENGGELQTMIGPYVGEIEQITEAGP